MKKQSLVYSLLAITALTVACVWQAYNSPAEIHDTSMTEWIVLSLPTNHPETPADEEAGRQQARKLPAPESLQPMLDSELRGSRFAVL